MSAPPYIECPSCGSAAVTRSTKRDRCTRCGHAAPKFERRRLDPTAFDNRPRSGLAYGGAWVRPTCRDEGVP